jgi:hypothetical protein
LFKYCGGKIKQLDPKDSQSKEAKVLKNLQSQLTGELSGLHSQFTRSQKQYLQSENPFVSLNEHNTHLHK